MLGSVSYHASSTDHSVRGLPERVVPLSYHRQCHSCLVTITLVRENPKLAFDALTKHAGASPRTALVDSQKAKATQGAARLRTSWRRVATAASSNCPTIRPPEVNQMHPSRIGSYTVQFIKDIPLARPGLPLVSSGAMCDCRTPTVGQLKPIHYLLFITLSGFDIIYPT